MVDSFRSIPGANATRRGDVWREKALVCVAPSLLCIIALLQIYLVRTASLSPWKGGGFGMFSTVDSSEARFLRIYLVTEVDEIPILVPDSLNPLARKARTIPTLQNLTGLGQHLAQGTWVPYEFVSAMQRYQNLHAGDEAFPDTSATGDISTGMMSVVESEPTISLEGLDLFRMVEPGEAEPPPGSALEFTSVRVELWKYRFDNQTLTLIALPHSEVTVAR